MSNDAVILRAVNPAMATIPNVSQAVLVEGGKLLFLSGHVPLRADGSVVGPGLEAQLDQAFRNVAATLAEAAADFSNVARLTLYVRGLTEGDLPVVRAVRDRYIDQARPPASALIGVAALFDERVRVEIDAVAAVA